MTVFQFIDNVLGFDGQYTFLSYIVACVLLLILVDGIITFIFGGISDLTTKGRR